MREQTDLEARKGGCSPYRPWRVLVAVVSALLVLAGASLVFLALRDFSGYRWPDGAAIPIDGAAHAIDLEPGERALAWDLQAHSPPACAVREERTGEPVPLVPDDDGYHRPGGSTGDYVGVFSFESPAGSVVVECKRRHGSGSRDYIFIERKPMLPPALAAWGPGLAVPAALVGAAMIVALGGGWLLRQRRHVGN